MPQSAKAQVRVLDVLLKGSMLAFSYAVVGKLALMLAIPPGYATAIFPSAGIAVIGLLLYGYRLAPGVFAGSLLLNLWVALDKQADISAGVPVALGVATGAMLQALLACYLVRRWVRSPTELTRDTDIMLFLLLAGPLSCLVNASVGIGVLYSLGLLGTEQAAYSWFTWWVGDTLGVIVSAPLLFMLLLPMQAIWRKRRLAVGVPLILLSTGLIWMFIKFSHWEVRQKQFEFKEHVNVVLERLDAKLDRYHLLMGTLERYFNFSNSVAPHEFSGFAAYLLQSGSDVTALTWNPYITQAQRADYEKGLQQLYQVPFIFNLPSVAKPEPAATADAYVVVQDAEPLASNERAIGLNLLSEPVRAAALLYARDSGQLAVTEKIILAQTGDEAFIMFQPVYSQPANSIETRRQYLSGYLSGIFSLRQMVQKLLSESDAGNVDMRLLDLSSNGQLLFQSAEMPQGLDPALSMSQVKQIGNRHWQIDCWLSERYQNQSSDFLAFAVLCIGLLFTAILGAFLLVITGRAHQVGHLVAKRSAELKGVLDNALDAILTFDAQGLIDSINPAGETLLRYPATTLLGQRVGLILPGLALADSDQAPDAAPPAISAQRFDSVARRKDGTEVAVEVALSDIHSNDTNRYSVILRDLTERQRTEQLKDDIISTVSHELRTPLTSIMGSLGLVNSGVLGELPPKAAELVSLAQQNSQRLTALVNDILELSKYQANKYQLQCQPIKVADFLASALRLNHGYANQYQVTLALELNDHHDVYIEGDELKLMQVMSNLLSNAIKYSPTGETVTVGLTVTANEVDISVADNGSGIPLAFQQAVFQRFSQADSTDTRRVGGTGLGLAIAKLIVEKHQGQIWFESEPDVGTTFYLRFARR